MLWVWEPQRWISLVPSETKQMAKALRIISQDSWAGPRCQDQGCAVAANWHKRSRGDRGLRAKVTSVASVFWRIVLVLTALCTHSISIRVRYMRGCKPSLRFDNIVALHISAILSIPLLLLQPHFSLRQRQFLSFPLKVSIYSWCLWSYISTKYEY